MSVELNESGVDLDQEVGADGFSGVVLERNNETGFLEMCQDVFIEKIVEALGLDDFMLIKNYMPLEGNPLARDKYGPPDRVHFSYIIVVVMLLYMVGHMRLTISYTVNCCAQYMFSPKYFHELVLKQIGRYL